MPSTLSLTTAPAHVRAVPASAEPPAVDEIAADDPAALVERLCDAVADRSPLPAPAVREVVENLVHAGFRDAVVSVLDDGAVVRVSDHGPGIADPTRALAPGFSSAGPAERAVVRGVGGGLPLAQALIEAAGGRLEIEAAREILALLLELGGAAPDVLARELRRPRAECGRELALLQHRGLVSREPDGVRRLTASGSALLTALF